MYEPAAKPEGNFATTTWLVDETKVSVMLFNVTAGAANAGCKLLPLMVI
jgi:hypothetical protein